MTDREKLDAIETLCRASRSESEMHLRLDILEIIDERRTPPSKQVPLVDLLTTDPTPHEDF